MAEIFTTNYSGEYGRYYEFRIDAEESDVSTTNNTSKVTAKAYLRRTNSSANGAYNQNGTAWSITIDGTTTSGTSKWDTRNTSAWQELGTATKTITHNTDGSKTITISGSHTGNSASGSSKMGNASGSGNFTLTNIPRYTSISSFTVSKYSETALKFNWQTADIVDYVWYSTNNGSNWTGYDVSDGTSGNFIVSGLSANTSYNCKIRVRRKDSQLTTDSSAVTQTTYAKIIPTISLSNKTSTSITINWTTNINCSKVQYKINNGNWIDVAGSGRSGSYTITELSPGTSYTILGDFKSSDSGMWVENPPSINVTTYQRTIPTISLSNKTSTSITVTSSCNVSVSSTQYRIKTSSGSYGSYQTSNTFSNLSSNTTYVIEVNKVGANSGEVGTATINVTTYQRTIPTISLTSKSVNSIVVNSSCNVSVSNTLYRIRANNGNYGNYQTSNTFSNLSPNTNYIIEVGKTGADSGEVGTATLSVTTYDIARITSAPDINLGDSARVIKTNPSGTHNSIRIETLNPTTNIAIRDVNTSDDMTIVFTDSELDELYKKLGNNNSITIRYVVDTVANGSYYYHWVDRTLTLTGNQKTGHININNSWKRSKKWININGTWRRCVRWININGTWRRCI